MYDLLQSIGTYQSVGSCYMKTLCVCAGAAVVSVAAAAIFVLYFSKCRGVEYFIIRLYCNNPFHAHR